MQTKYSEEMADAICALIAQDKSMRYAAAQLNVSRQSMSVWLMKHPEFSDKLARARESQAQFVADDMRQIENKVLRGTLDPAAANVLLGSKRWRAERCAPRRFGVRQQIELDAKIEQKRSPDEIRAELKQLAADPEIQALLANR